jgi:molybdopterin/thiamine biosynthesis adenylyltransferase
MVNKILLIGAGGIMSYCAEELNRLILKDQIDLEEVDITIVDDDLVETKNIKYQNFTKEDVFKNKAEVIGDRYGFGVLKKRIKSAKELEGYDLIVIGADNGLVRKLVYDYCYSNNKYFIDLRAEGRAIAFFTKESKQKDVTDKLGKEIKDEGTSCQNAYELDKGMIQNGNKIIAAIGSQLLLNWLRGDLNAPELIIRI